MSVSTPDPRPVVLIPIFNDLPSCAALLQRMEATPDLARSLAEVVIVDDGSNRVRPEDWRQFLSDNSNPEQGAIVPRTVVHLRRNVGHQRAIALGLCWVQSQTHLSGPVIVMDGDGEDLPGDLPRLIDALSQSDSRDHGVVFAERRRRSEGLLFRVCYHSYRLIHVALTGIPVRFGNFSILSRGALDRIVVVNELWNHYAAAIVKSRLAYSTIPTVRGVRLAGQTQMNFPALVIHGLGALSVFAEIISVRLLYVVVLLLILALTETIPALLSILLLQSVAIFIGLFFGLSALRSGNGLIPLRDYPLFILRVARSADSSIDSPPAAPDHHD